MADEYTVELWRLEFSGPLFSIPPIEGSHFFWAVRDANGAIVTEIHGFAYDPDEGIAQPIGMFWDQMKVSFTEGIFFTDSSRYNSHYEGTVGVLNGPTQSFNVQEIPYENDLGITGPQTHILTLPAELAGIVGFQNSINSDNVGYNILVQNSNSIASTIGEILGVPAETFANLHDLKSDDWGWGKDLLDPANRSDPWFSGGPDDLADPDLKGAVVQGPNGQKAVIIYGENGAPSRVFVADADGTVTQHVYLPDGSIIVVEHEQGSPGQVIDVGGTLGQVSDELALHGIYVDPGKAADIGLMQLGNDLQVVRAIEGAGNIGNSLGSTVGRMVAGDNVFAQIGATTAIGTLAENFAETVWNGGLTVDLASVDNYTVLDNFGDELRTNLRGAVAGTLSSFLTAELGEAMGLEGFGAALFNVTAGAYAGSVLNQVIANGGNFTNVNWTQGFRALPGAVGTFFGSSLAQQILPAETQAGSIGGALGSVAGSTLAGAVLGGTLSTIGNFLVPGIGAFFGTLIGTFLGDLFGDDPPDPFGKSFIFVQEGTMQGYWLAVTEGGFPLEAMKDWSLAAGNAAQNYLDITGGLALSNQAQVVSGGGYSYNGQATQTMRVRVDNDDPTYSINGNDVVSAAVRISGGSGGLRHPAKRIALRRPAYESRRHRFHRCDRARSRVSGSRAFAARPRLLLNRLSNRMNETTLRSA